MSFDGECGNEECHPRQLPKVQPGDEVVISGIAGRFPESDDIRHLQENLMNKVDLVTEDDRRWKLDHPDLPKRGGKISNLEKFDAVFFGIHTKQAHTMDPLGRMLLEHTYEAIVDAGVNPKQIRDSRTGVFVGANFCESEKTLLYEKCEVSEKNGFAIVGCARSMLANRISYWLGVTGPSYIIDTACSSSLTALEHAYRAIREGVCDAAIIGSGNLCLQPQVTMKFFKLGVLSVDGRCKAFDESANGYVRSEAVSVLFLQKAKDAKRVYATIVHGKTNSDGFKERGITFPSSHRQSVLFKEFYLECGISPTLVDYVEAHAPGTGAGDPVEAEAIVKVFCQGRETPLKVGSCKSNLGHTEPASGMCGVAKVIISMESGLIPPNLHYEHPRQDIKALQDGRIEVVTELTPWRGNYAAVNSFGFGGSNAHVLLKMNSKTKINNGMPEDGLPRLVAVSGRTKAAVETIIYDLSSRPVDVEQVRLLHNVHSDDINGHLYRGYTILPPHGISAMPVSEIQYFPGAKRPIWFVFSGMGSQWPGMGESLLRIPVFNEAIKKCDTALKPYGIDVFHIITNKDEAAFHNILNSFVGIAAVQIGIVDILSSVGIKADYMIGHSVGELGCAYADGCFTVEQMILSAYSRGMASIETQLIYGSMAAVGMGYNDLKKLCPSDIDIACRNSVGSATISGPAESMKKFVAELENKKIFAKEVATSNIPYHSRYIAPAGEKLMKYLQKVIPNPKPRSAKWLSTSVPMAEWGTWTAQYSSAEYHTNNLLSPVLFEETSALIPNDAVTIEIAPHGLLQAILRRSLEPSVTNIALTHKGHKDNVEVLLEGLGKMFTTGLHPQLANIYPCVTFPVSRSTPMISPMIKWEHSDDWFVDSYKSQQKIVSGERIVEISVTDPDFKAMIGHVADGRNLFPVMGYMVLVWETIGMMHEKLYTEFPVVFEDMRFLRPTTIPKEGTIIFTIMIQKGTGRFEVIEGGAAVMTGYVHASANPSAEKINASIPESNEAELMKSDDIYKELRLRGYNYRGSYRSIKSATTDCSKGRIAWNHDWVAFIDGMLQMQILSIDSRGLLVPIGIKKLVIDTKTQHSQMKDEFPVYANKIFESISCGGVEIRGLKLKAMPRKKAACDSILEEYKFIPFFDRADVSLFEISRLVTHLSLENCVETKVKIIELVEEKDNISTNNILSPHISESIRDMPLIEADINIISTNNKLKNVQLPSNVSVLESMKINFKTNALLASGSYLFTENQSENLNLLISCLKEGGFLLTREAISNLNNIQNTVFQHKLDVVMEKRVGKELFILLRKLKKDSMKIAVVNVNNNSFEWIENMRKAMAEALKKETRKNLRIVFVGQGDFENGLIGLVNCLRKEPGGEVVRSLFIQDIYAPSFSIDNILYAKQLEKDLAVSVLRKNGVWGSYRHLPLSTQKLQPVRHAWLNQLVRGDLSSLTWTNGPIHAKYDNERLIKVYYSSINFRDVMLISGNLANESVVTTRLSEESVLGFEYCGIDVTNKRVMGLIKTRAITNLCIADQDLCWEIPDHWSLEDAVTVPGVYGTCYWALYKCGKMKKGDKVLIHAGADDVGQAAINLALHEGCEVFTTVQTEVKRKFIIDNFPQIKKDHIGNSLDISFEVMIIEQTNGKGVDIILNSLIGENMQSSINCLAKGGKFLEIGKFDSIFDNPLGRECFLREINCQCVMLDSLLNGFRENKIELKKLISEGLKNGAIKPITRIVYLKDQVEAAFRYALTGKHIGKVVIKVRDERESADSFVTALPRYYCLGNRSYIIIGGLGGFGLELADWLVLRGARHLVLTSRSGIKNGYQRMRINLWKSYGVKVVTISDKDASKLDDCQYILDSARALAPVDAIFNLALDLKDALWESQTSELFEESFKSKAWVAKSLDVISRKSCPMLRHFVMFSSVFCGRGNASQSNYAMSNSAMERICERRTMEGLPALAIQWGPVGDVGFVADTREDHEELVISGTRPQPIVSCLTELDGFLQQNRPVVSSMIVADKKTSETSCTNVADAVLSIIGRKDFKGVSPNTSLAELGMDSMMSVDVQQTLEREFNIFLTAKEIRGLTFAKLTALMISSE